MGIKKTHKQAAGFLSYVLGRRPDEFGLVPDDNGFVTLKELLKAASEEEGWRHVTRGTINELTMAMAHPPVEIDGSLIRAVDRKHLPERVPALDPPKLLYAGITAKSYPAVLEKGIFPTRHTRVILCPEKGLAVRIAKRRDRSPVILTVNTMMAMDAGVLFFQQGENIYLASHVPTGCFTGPPVTREKKPSVKSESRDMPQEKAPAGSFFVDLKELNGMKGRRQDKKDRSWKRDKKKIRRQKKKEWPD